MRAGKKASIIATILLALTLALAAVATAGCGDGSDGYTQVVLGEWAKLEAGSEKLVKAADRIEDEGDLEDFSGDLADSREDVEAFGDLLGDIEVPPQAEESNEALDDFLAAYDEYLEALEDSLNAVITGEELDYTADLDTPAVEAEEALEDYQDSQDYNSAKLDRDIWDLPGMIGEAIVNIYGGVIDDQYAMALETLDAWYYYYNTGDGDAMWQLLDFDSPIANSLRYEQFTTFIGEGYGSGLSATYYIDDYEGMTDASGDWLTVYLTVDYSESLGMEDEIIPAYSENVVVELVNREDGWYVYDVTSSTGLF